MKYLALGIRTQMVSIYSIAILSYGCSSNRTSNIEYSESNFINHSYANSSDSSTFTILYANENVKGELNILKKGCVWFLLEKSNDIVTETPFVDFSLSEGDTIFSKPNASVDRIMLEVRNSEHYILERCKKQIFQNVPGEGESYQYTCTIYVIEGKQHLVDVINYGVERDKITFISDISNNQYRSHDMEQKIIRYFDELFKYMMN